MLGAIMYCNFQEGKRGRSRCRVLCGRVARFGARRCVGESAVGRVWCALVVLRCALPLGVVIGRVIILW